MNNAKLTAKVTEAVLLDREIAEKTERLKELKAQLIVEAQGSSVEKTETDGGGWSAEFTADDGSIARVTQPGQKLKASVDAESDTWNKLRELKVPGIINLFNPAVKYVTMPLFREELAAKFEKPVQTKILKLMTVKSAATVNFETKEAA
jgi:hypothetical protein